MNNTSVVIYESKTKCSNIGFLFFKCVPLMQTNVLTIFLYLLGHTTCSVASFLIPDSVFDNTRFIVVRFYIS